jgi:hypothetical protein
MDLASAIRTPGSSQMWPHPVQEARDYLDRISAQWDSALTRLKSLVEIDTRQSVRSTLAGSTVAARLAGINPASTATMQMINTPAK